MREAKSAPRGTLSTPSRRTLRVWEREPGRRLGLCSRWNTLRICSLRIWRNLPMLAQVELCSTWNIIRLIIIPGCSLRGTPT